MSTFQAGAARVVITPPIGVPLSGYFAAEGRKETARDVHDDLFARALVMNDGVKTIAIVTTDLIGLGEEELEEVREIVQRDADIQLAVLLSYACHPVVLGPNLEISADYVGYAVNFIERSLGEETVALFANGAQGDMNSIVHPGTYADAERLGCILGEETLKVVQSTKTHESVQISTATRNTELPLNPDSTPERQREYIRFLQNEYQRHTALGDAKHAWGIEMRLAVAGYRLHNREHISNPFLNAEVTAFGLKGDGVSVGIISEPAELFCEYGIRARKHSPFSTTLVLGLANGFIGYIPTPNVYTEGGYECEATNVAPGAGDQLCQTMIDALHAVA